MYAGSGCARCVAQVRRVRAGPAVGGRHVAGELLLPGPVLGHHDDRLGDGRVGGQRGLDLAQLDPQAADLDLAVDAAEEDDGAVRPPADQVAGLVQASAPCGTGPG